MKRFSIDVVLAAVAVMSGHSARGELVDRVAAVVNTQIITLSEVEKRAAPELATLADSKDKAAHPLGILRRVRLRHNASMPMPQQLYLLET